MTEVHLTLDAALAERAAQLGDLPRVVDRALRLALDPAETARRRRWLEDNALLIEAARGASEGRV